jgi:hypothetical protein
MLEIVGEYYDGSVLNPFHAATTIFNNNGSFLLGVLTLSEDIPLALYTNSSAVDDIAVVFTLSSTFRNMSFTVRSRYTTTTIPEWTQISSISGLTLKNQTKKISLHVGDFGFGATTIKQALIQDNDLNNLITSGFYVTGTQSTTLNKPDVGSYPDRATVVVGGVTGYVFQIYSVPNRTYIRFGTGTPCVWDSWKELADTSSVNAKQDALNRTVVVNDDGAVAITDTGGNLSIPVPVTTVAPTASNTQKAAGTTSLRSVIQIVIDNIAYLFANMQTKLSRTVTGNDNATGTVTDTGGNLSIPVPVTTVAPTASATIQAAGTRSLRTAIQSILDNLKQIFDTMVTLTGTQTLTNKTLEAVRVTEKAFNATGTSGTITVDCANGNKALLTPTGNITGWTFNNVPATGNSYILNIQITGSGTVRSVAYPTNIKWKKDIVPEITWTNGRKTFIILETSDGGVSWEGRW